MSPGHRDVPWNAVADALATLGVTPTSSWAEIRTSYREQIRATHPDLSSDGSASTAHTASLNLAWEVLAAATQNGRHPLPAAPDPEIPPPATPVPEIDLDDVVTLHAAPGDIFVQLLDAAYEVGDVNYMDPEAGLIQVVLESHSGPAPLLMINVDVEARPPAASFTLDAADRSTAPPIRTVVERLAAALRSD